MTVTLVLAVLLAGVAPAQRTAEQLRNFRAPAVEPTETVPGFVWVEAESFADYGGWAIDTQFVHRMGSAYLIAKGVLKPLAPAKTKVCVRTPGTWHAWVRTKDWLPEFSPGKFALSLGGRRSGTLGATKKEGWRWERAGRFALDAGEHEMELVDLAGAFARCDAVLLTTDARYEPPADDETLAAERLRLSGRDPRIADGGEYDVVVVGGGPAGLGAAIAAARNGARTVMVHDRPVLGGNASIEQHTGICGANSYNRVDGAADTREGGVVEESRLLCWLGGHSNSSAFRKMVDDEPNLTERANERVVAAERKGDRVVSVTAFDTLTGRRTRYRGKAFVDGTGDGWIGHFVGAEMMYGREAKSEYGEPDAPETRDDLTMSGCIDDYVYHDVGREVPFEVPAWAKVLPEGFDRPDINNLNARWWLEHPGTFDDLRDPERARDELIRIHVDYWGFMRRHPKFGAQARRCTLDEVKFHNGRREGWRMLGDYVLTSVDCREGRIFDDAVAYGGWALDTHDPQGVMNPKGNGWWKCDRVPVYTIPYRCLYSKNIANLYAGGRNISVTHAALGTTRVMATIFMTAQAAGTAAALTALEGVAPRDIGRRRIRDLQQRLLRDDQFIPGVKNADPRDLARTAKVTASSSADLFTYDENDSDLNGRFGPWAWWEGLWLPIASAFPRNGLDRLEAVVCHLRNTSGMPREETMDVYESDTVEAPDATRTHRATVKATVAPGTAPVKFAFAQPLKLSKKFVWIRLAKCDGLQWASRLHVFPEGGCLAYDKKPGELDVRTCWQQAFYTLPYRTGRIDAKPENVIDGETRHDLWPRLGTSTHGWRADPKAALPQEIRLDFPKPVVAREVRLVFDSEPVVTSPGVKALVKDYAVLGLVNGTWKTLAETKDNMKRLAVHRFAPETVSAVKVRVDATRGYEPRIQEVRVY